MSGHEHEEGGIPHLPPPTPWPLFVGLGMSMTLGGMVMFLGRQTVPWLVIPVLGFALFMFAVVMMLRDDVIAFDENGHGHG